MYCISWSLDFQSRIQHILLIINLRTKFGKNVKLMSWFLENLSKTSVLYPYQTYWTAPWFRHLAVRCHNIWSDFKLVVELMVGLLQCWMHLLCFILCNECTWFIVKGLVFSLNHLLCKTLSITAHYPPTQQFKAIEHQILDAMIFFAVKNKSLECRSQNNLNRLHFLFFIFIS